MSLERLDDVGGAEGVRRMCAGWGILNPLGECDQCIERDVAFSAGEGVEAFVDLRVVLRFLSAQNGIESKSGFKLFAFGGAGGSQNFAHVHGGAIEVLLLNGELCAQEPITGVGPALIFREKLPERFSCDVELARAQGEGGFIAQIGPRQLGMGAEFIPKFETIGLTGPGKKPGYVPDGLRLARPQLIGGDRLIARRSPLFLINSEKSFLRVTSCLP